MKNTFKLSFLMIPTLIMFLMVSCQKENFDNSKTTVGEFEPEANYTGADNLFGFTLQTIDHNTSTTISVVGGSSIGNSMTKEILSNGEIRWTVLSTFTDGITVTNEISFITPDTSAGVYPIEKIHYKSEDTAGMVDEYIWTEADISSGGITVSGLGTHPGIVSGNTGDVLIENNPDTSYFYIASWSEVPIN